jgi:hypothetical protein
VIFVDAFDASGEGPFTLTLNFTVAVCGDNQVTLPEECDPADNVTCDANCQFLPESLCDDFLNNDDDGLIDCNDPDCQGTASCTPGAAVLGDPCAASSDCAPAVAGVNNPACLGELNLGFPGGSCSNFCEADADCGANGVCAQLDDNNSICLESCTVVGDCRAAYDCVDLGGVSACLPNCTADADCALTGHCDVGVDDNNQGSCTQTELCADGVDNDRDGATDCEDQFQDTTCNADLACQLVYAADCALATAAQASNTGDTSGAGSNNFVGSCQLSFGGGGGQEEIFTFTPGNAGETGVLTVVLASATDQGVYVRSACADAATELGCADDNLGGENEVLSIPIADAGAEVAIFVDAFLSNEQGPFTLTVSFAGPLETEPNDDIANANEVFGAGSIDPGTDVDFIQLALTAGQTLTVETSDFGSGGCADLDIDTEVTLLDVDGTTELANNDDINNNNFCSLATTTVAADGTYFIKVNLSPLGDPAAPGFAYELKVTVQ